jgi:hypothetical protein
MNLLILKIKCILKTVKIRNILALLPRELSICMKNIQVRTQVLTFIKPLLQTYIDYNLSCSYESKVFCYFFPFPISRHTGTNLSVPSKPGSKKS